MVGLKLDMQWSNVEVQVLDGHTHTHTVVVSLTGLLSLLAAALSSCVQHHLLDDVQLLIHSGEVEVCALFRHCCKV